LTDSQLIRGAEMFRKSRSCNAAGHERRRTCTPGGRSTAFVELIATAALALSTAVAATAVSIGMARAGVAGTVSGAGAALSMIALLTAVLLSALAHAAISRGQIEQS
jgi:hypothetical protein